VSGISLRADRDYSQRSYCNSAVILYFRLAGNFAVHHAHLCPSITRFQSPNEKLSYAYSHLLASIFSLSLIRTHLTAIQSRILVSLFQSDGSHYVPNETVLEKTGIAQSTWSEEQKRLIEMGLLEKKAFKMLRTNSVSRIVNFRLTAKGRTVAFNLANISRMIVQPRSDAHGSAGSQSSQPLSEGEFEFEVMEAIEVALDSFGINLIPLVKGRLAEGFRWDEVARHPEIFTIILRDLFGKEGSATVESMIVENLKSRFALGSSISENDLTNLVAELRRTRVVDGLTQDSKLPHARTESG